MEGEKDYMPAHATSTSPGKGLETDLGGLRIDSPHEFQEVRGDNNPDENNPLDLMNDTVLDCIPK
jgi:hypothetical protein